MASQSRKRDSGHSNSSVSASGTDQIETFDLPYLNGGSCQ